VKGKVTCEVRGNVVWLTYPARDRKRQSTDPLAALKRSVAALAREIEWSQKLRNDIAAGVDARRYELYKGTVILGGHGERGLADAQGIHLGSLLKFIHSVAAGGQDERRGERRPAAARSDRLAKSISDLQASLRQAQQLSRDMLAQCRRHDWSGRP
jgi:ribosomal protein S6E (S10)